MASIDGSIVLISLPAIFKGIGVNPLAPGQTGYFLWLLIGYMVVTAILLVTFGRISDMFGRVRLYNLGIAILTVGSTLLAFTPGTGSTGAVELIVFRIVQGIGAGFLAALARGGLQFMLIICFKASGCRFTGTAMRRRRCGRAFTWCRSSRASWWLDQSAATSPTASARASSRPRACSYRSRASSC
jgi:MFS family permease